MSQITNRIAHHQPKFKLHFHSPDPLVIHELAGQLDLPRLVVEILYNRGFTTKDSIEDFLYHSKKNPNYDPFLLIDMEKAIDRIIKAIDSNETIGLFGDYDVDGVTGTAVLYHLFNISSHILKKVIPLEIYLPDRMRDGYGLNNRIIDHFKDRKVSLIITIDNGTAAHEAITYAKGFGIDMIVTDHHHLPDTMPDAVAIVNPKRNENKYPFKYLCGSALAHKLGIAIASKLFPKEHQENFESRFTDLAAIGTYQDVSIMTGENRYIMKKGQEVLESIINEKMQTKITGLIELYKVCAFRDSVIDWEKMGWGLGPRINAAGRIASPMLAFELLTTTDPENAKALALELNNLNTYRKQLKEKYSREAHAMIARYNLDREAILLVVSEDWHKGVIGLIAQELKEEYSRPAIVLSAYESKGKYTASCRSTEALDITHLLQKFSEYFISVGGHAKAAGFSITSENLDPFKEAFKAYTQAHYEIMDMRESLSVDCECSLEELNGDGVYDALFSLEPFGEMNELPVISLRECVVDKSFISKRGLDSIVCVAQGSYHAYGVTFNNTDIANSFHKGDVVDVVLRLEFQREERKFRFVILSIYRSKGQIS